MQNKDLCNKVSLQCSIFNVKFSLLVDELLWIKNKHCPKCKKSQVQVFLACICSITIGNLFVYDFVIPQERYARTVGQEKLNTIVKTRYSMALLAKHLRPLSAMMGYF